MAERIATAFGAASTAAEVIKDIDLSGKYALVTGAASGIGVETARALAGAGADVTLAVRDVRAGAGVAAEITRTTGNDNVHVSPLELDDAESIHRFTQTWGGPLDILFANAGVMAIPELQLGRNGYEMQFATNHLGHFALAHGLRGALRAACGSRIVVVSSGGHFRSPVIFEDINFTARPYDRWAAYGQSKTANILFAVEATKRWQGDRISVNAVHPGGIRTNLQRHLSPEELKQFLGPEEQSMEARRGSVKVAMKTVEQGAATSVFVATSPLLEAVGGSIIPIVLNRP